MSPRSVAIVTVMLTIAVMATVTLTAAAAPGATPGRDASPTAASTGDDKAGQTEHVSFVFKATKTLRDVRLGDEGSDAVESGTVTLEPGSMSQATGSAHGVGTITIKGRLYYKDEHDVWRPARETRVVLMDDDAGTDETVASTLTGYDGKFSFTVNNDDGLLQGGRDPYVKVLSDGASAFTTTGAGVQYAAATELAGTSVPDGFTYDYGTFAPGANNEAWQLIDAITSERDWVRQHTSPSWQRSKVQVRWPFESLPHAHSYSIDMPAKTTAGWTHVTTYHLYAHCIMWSLYGALPAGSGPNPHYIYSESSPGFAMTEGWAEYMQAAVDGLAANLSAAGQNIETNAWQNVIDSGEMDGEKVEGSVASILWDIVDPTSATDRDTLSAPFANVFTVLRYDKPQNMSEFWTRYAARWPALAASVGPLCTIYWHYGIDKDTFAPYGISPMITLTSAANVPGWTKTTAVAAHLKAGDYGSGVASMRLANAGSWGSFLPYAGSAAWTVLPGDGTKYVWVQFRDGKGRDSFIYAAIIKLDATAPTGSVSINAGAASCTSTAVTLTLAAADGAGCGVASYRAWNEGSPAPATWTAFTATRNWTLTSGVGTKRVFVQYKDRLGNVSAAFSDAIALRVATTLSASTAAVIPYGGKATVTGVLQGANGAFLEGKPVTLWAAPPGGSWSSVATTTTAGGGKYVLTTPALETTRQLKVRFAGDGGYAPSWSPVRTATPKAWVTAPTAPATPQKGVAFVSDSFLKPRHNAASSALLLQCLHYEKKADNTYGYVLKSTVGMTAADYLAYSRCSASLSLSLTGKWALRAYHAADAANAATFSTFTYITVN